MFGLVNLFIGELKSLAAITKLENANEVIQRQTTSI